MEYVQLVICISVITTTFAAKLPSSFVKCDWKQSDCLTRAVPDAISQLTEAMKEANLPSLDSLVVPPWSAAAAGTKGLSLAQQFDNMKLYGLSKITCTKVEFDSNDKTLKMNCLVPNLLVDTQYEINGKVLMMPVFGKGHATLSYDELAIECMCKLEEYKKRTRTHLRVVRQQLTLTPKWLAINLENLFNGDKALGDNINKVLNDNWAAFFEDVRPNYEEAIGQVFGSIFNRFLAKVPISELMDS